jgi:hypothetical protein
VWLESLRREILGTSNLTDDDRQVRLACKCRILCGSSQDLRPA